MIKYILILCLIFGACAPKYSHLPNYPKGRKQNAHALKKTSKILTKGYNENKHTKTKKTTEWKYRYIVVNSTTCELLNPHNKKTNGILNEDWAKWEKMKKDKVNLYQYSITNQSSHSKISSDEIIIISTFKPGRTYNGRKSKNGINLK